jgi:hypothetical protein
MRKSQGYALFEAAQLLMRQQAALSNPQTPALAAKPELTAEEKSAKVRRDTIAGWQELNERYRREAGTRRSY